MATNKSTKVNNNMSNNNETKVMCPVCGSEFAIDGHEHTLKNATVIGADSGLGNIYLPVSKRGNALNAAGIDTSKYFSINLPTGGQQMMKMGDYGKAVPVGADDPIVQAIMGGGTVPNKNLFRRWVMSQVFHGLTDKWGGFSRWLKTHGYKYTWEMLVEELRVQAKLAGRDWENFKARNRWFNQELAVKMAADYIDQMHRDAINRPIHKCKGVPYITFSRQNVFMTDIDKKLVAPMRNLYWDIKRAKGPQKLYEAVRAFVKAMYSGNQNYDQCAAWKDAYKGMGAYATMQNLLRFHDCTFPMNNDFYNPRLSGLKMLENAAEEYADSEGWRLFGLMKQMLEENDVNIVAKMKEWQKAKQAKNLKR